MGVRRAASPMRLHNHRDGRGAPQGAPLPSAADPPPEAASSSRSPPPQAAFTPFRAGRRTCAAETGPRWAQCPVVPFVAPWRSAPPVPPGRARDCLAARSRATPWRCASYSGPAPTLEDLKHLAAWPGTGYHPGPSRASRISAALDALGHVAEPVCYGRSYADTCSPSGGPQSPRGSRLEISGGRSQKSPLTRSAEFFAVRHRLPEHSLASPPTRLVGPLTVELFTFGGFYGS